MGFKVVNVGFGNYVLANRVVAVLNPASAPIRRLRNQAKEQLRLIDATQGRKTRSVIVMDSNHALLSGIQAETIASRLSDEPTSNDVI